MCSVSSERDFSGYRPMRLKLVGFIGIRDGLGREQVELDFDRLASDAQLIAIAGRNGRGKSTVLDNLHPYLVMPGRAGDGGPAFSYYDHVYLPESLKELAWAHDGQCYRTQLVFRLQGRRRQTGAYLHRLQEGRWMPVHLADGTTSDGKVETYTACVEAILGHADTFFVSAFCAQGRRQLSSYRNGEIKALLADLLGLEAIRHQGAQAQEVVRLIKAGLSVMREEGAQLDAEELRIMREVARLSAAGAQLADAQQARIAAMEALETARGRQQQLEAARQAAAQTDARRRQLQADLRALEQRQQEDRQRVEAQRLNEESRLKGLDQRIAERLDGLRSRRRTLEDRRATWLGSLAQGAQVAWARRRQPLLAEIVDDRLRQVDSCRVQIEHLARLQVELRALQAQMAGVEREAGQAALRQADLVKRFGLTMEVPCAGSALQGQCRLLADAHEARALMPKADERMAAIAEQRAILRRQQAALEHDLANLLQAQQQLLKAEQRLHRSRTRLDQVSQLAARAGEMAQAGDAVASLEAELAALPMAEGESSEEAAERVRIAAMLQSLSEQCEAIDAKAKADASRLRADLAALPSPFDGTLLQRAAEATAAAQRAYPAADAGLVVAQQASQRHAVLVEQQASVRQRQAGLRARTDSVAESLSTWTLLALCLSNDGLIALAIDDAGPGLSALANELLLGCYGPRFALELRTLVETAKGEAREGFDIVVHDADAEQPKRLAWMSGGERVVINECVTRAIALYLVTNTGRHYGTLFSDEADGPLDPDRKRAFLLTKRTVLRLGGYQREYFVSQTPELIAMADAVIDMDALAAAPHQA